MIKVNENELIKMVDTIITAYSEGAFFYNKQGIIEQEITNIINLDEEDEKKLSLASENYFEKGERR